MSSSPSGRIVSRRAKQQLVELLFGSDLRRKGRQAHLLLDPTQYNYQDLRRAYLERLQEIHPDKRHRHNHSSFLASSIAGAHSSSHSVGEPTRKELHDDFLKLQEAWQEYDKITKIVIKARQDTSNGAEESNFTRFGVGCSFSDSPEERRERDEIMNQASRGFFFSGAIPEKIVADGEVKDPAPSAVLKTPLTDESLFELKREEETVLSCASKTIEPSDKKTLVQDQKRRSVSSCKNTMVYGPK